MFGILEVCIILGFCWTVENAVSTCLTHRREERRVEIEQQRNMREQETHDIEMQRLRQTRVNATLEKKPPFWPQTKGVSGATTPLRIDFPEIHNFKIAQGQTYQARHALLS